MIKALTTNQFIEKSILKHGIKYDYSKVDYKNNRIKIDIGCPTHGFFEQRGGDHLVGKGCKKCANENLRSDFKYFLKKSKEAHGNLYKYPYDDYITSNSKIRIICRKHGEFKQIASSHTRGQGCPKCSIDNIISRQTRDGEEVLNDLISKHGDKYFYPNFEYKGSRFKINIECREHGIFKQVLGQHLLGRGCPKCGNKKTLEEFINDSRKVHGDLYEYFEYKKTDDKTKIICKKHGIFKQNAHHHLNGHGCPKCSNLVSKPEIEIQNFLKEMNYHIKTSDRTIIKPKELDIFIPSLNKAIEYNGQFWHYSKKYFKPGKHAYKSNLCKEKGITLLHIREELWIRDKEQMKEIIKKFLKIK